MFSTIVHPTDLSEACVPALKTAYELAKSLRARLIVYYIAHPPMVASGDKLTDPKSNQTRDIPQEVRAIQPFDPSVNTEVRVVTIDDTSSAKPLLSILESLECDLLVIGMHKKRGITGLLSRSLTEEVVTAAHCDVLVVKHHDEEAGNNSEAADKS